MLWRIQYCVDGTFDKLYNSFIKFQISYFPVIWMFCSRASMNKLDGIHEKCPRLVTNDYDSNFNELLESSHEILIHKTCINYLMIEGTSIYKGYLLNWWLTFLLFGKILTIFGIFFYYILTNIFVILIICNTIFAILWKSTVSAFWNGCNRVSWYSVVAKSAHSNKRSFITRNFQSKSYGVVTTAHVNCVKDLSPM